MGILCIKFYMKISLSFVLKKIGMILKNILGLNMLIKKIFSSFEGGLLYKIIFFSSILVLVAFLTSSLFLGKILQQVIENQIGKRALVISQTISLMPEVIDLVEKDDPHGRLQQTALQIQHHIDAQFIVIGNIHSQRLTHPNKELIGEKMVGEDNEKALKHGRSYISKSVGTLGPSIRGKSPIFNFKGEIIGIVSVGYLEVQVNQIIQDYYSQFLSYLYFALFVTILMAFLLSNKIKNSLLGYEPKEISRLFLEKQAILDSVKEAIIATDKNGKISMHNEVAKHYFHLESLNPTVPLPIQKIFFTCKERKDVNLEINGVDYICNFSPIIQDQQTIGMVASCRKKEEIDALVWELTRVKQYSERLREKKHEFSNLLHLISGYIQIGEYDKAIALIAQDHLPDEKIIEQFQDAIHDPVVASIFIGKYYFAFDKGVKVTLDPNSAISEKVSSPISRNLLIILGNIINNAIDSAMLSETKEVILFATDIGNDLIFEIEDSGNGIDKALMNTIFDKGFTTKGELHSGYGLFFVKNALEQLGGFVSIEKGNYGTIFSIHIPKVVHYD